MLSPVVRYVLALALVESALAAGETWRLDNLERVQGVALSVMGEPRVVRSENGNVLRFDGVRDGLMAAGQPLAGAKTFTVEVLFCPLEGGLREQRFLHIQDEAGRRGLLELRVDGRGSWWLDTFVRASAEVNLVLVDEKRTHPTGCWYWVAMRYDGEKLASFVNGRKELDGAIALPPFGAGTVSIGMRQNQVSWFKGLIREVRFHREALPESALQRLR